MHTTVKTQDLAVNVNVSILDTTTQAKNRFLAVKKRACLYHISSSSTYYRNIITQTYILYSFIHTHLQVIWFQRDKVLKCGLAHQLKVKIM